MLRFFRWIGRRIGLVKAEAPATVSEYDDWFEKMLKDLAPGDVLAWSAPAGSSWARAFPPLDADQQLQLAAEQFAAAVIDALQNG